MSAGRQAGSTPVIRHPPPPPEKGSSARCFFVKENYRKRDSIKGNRKLCVWTFRYLEPTLVAQGRERKLHAARHFFSNCPKGPSPFFLCKATMGNTIATPTSTHPAPSPSVATTKHSPESRPSTAGLSSSGHSSLRKMESSSTLSSLARFYHHANPSNTSMASRMSKSNQPRRKKHGEKVMDIGKPTQFEHGIHVEYNKENGRFMVRSSLMLTEAISEPGFLI